MALLHASRNLPVEADGRSAPARSSSSRRRKAPNKNVSTIAILKLLRPKLKKHKDKLAERIVPLLHVTAVLFVIFMFEGSHQRYINKTKLFWFFWLLLIGLLHGGPLRPGLPTQYLVIFPHIIRVSIGSQICSSMSFQCPPYPDVIKCPEIPEDTEPGVVQILMHLFPELVFWSLGTFLVNFPFYKLHFGVPDDEVDTHEHRIRNVIHEQLYFEYVENFVEKYYEYFSLFPYELLFQDSDVTAALAGLKRQSTIKFITDYVTFSVLGMNCLLMPLCISLACVISCKVFNIGFGILGFLSIDTSDIFYAPEDGFIMKVLIFLKDVSYYVAISYSLYRVGRRFKAHRKRK